MHLHILIFHYLFPGSFFPPVTGVGVNKDPGNDQVVRDIRCHEL